MKNVKEFNNFNESKKKDWAFEGEYELLKKIERLQKELKDAEDEYHKKLRKAMKKAQKN